MRIRLALLSLTACLLLACNSTESDDSTGGGKSGLLVGKNWKMVSFVLDPGINVNGVIVTDIFAQYDPCMKDGTTKFLANGTYADDEGALKCDPDDPQTLTGTWVFNPAETVLTMTETGDSPISYDIVTLTATSLVVSTSSSDFGDGLNHKATISFTATP
jgi:hypothetical protein